MKKKTVSQPNLGGRQETEDTVRYKGKGRRNGEEGLRRGRNGDEGWRKCQRPENLASGVLKYLLQIN